MTLNDKVVIITGASQGLGKILAEKIAKEGAIVALVARSKEKLQQLQKEILQHKGRAEVYACDITNLSQIEKTVKEIIKKYKKIDILINNAGIWTDNEIEKNHPEKRKVALDTNALGPIQFTQTLLPHFLEKNFGHILNVISTSGIEDTTARDNKHWQTYGATKWAMTGFTNALRDSLQNKQIKVTGFFPGGFDSTLYENADKSDAHNQPWMMKTEDIADILLFALTRPKDVVIEKIVVTKMFTHTDY